MQGRAEATRQKIIVAGIDVFHDKGYADAGLSDILRAAGLTKGAFYYHFTSKEALAATIAAEGWVRVMESIGPANSAATPALEDTIRMTFEINHLVRHDRLVNVGYMLNQKLGQSTAGGRISFQARADEFRQMVRSALNGTDVRRDLDADEVTELIWIATTGNLLAAEAMGDDGVARLTRTWRGLMRACVPNTSLDYFDEFLVRTAAQYQPKNAAQSA